MTVYFRVAFFSFAGTFAPLSFLYFGGLDLSGRSPGTPRTRRANLDLGRGRDATRALIISFLMAEKLAVTFPLIPKPFPIADQDLIPLRNPLRSLPALPLARAKDKNANARL
jgi:hypothetical protein